MRIAERTPEAVLEFWLGPLRTINDTTEDNWRNGMLKWRVGVFARGSEDERFREAQRDWCEALHKEGVDQFFADPIWDTPKGKLAKIIVLDQFGRCVYRGTPVAYANDEITPPLLREVCDKGWDITEYNEVERMWVYVSLSHPERRDLQQLSVEKWTQWSHDLCAASPRELKQVNQHVSWYFIKSIVEHAEAVLLYGRFPHRNPIMNRPHKANEVYYLTDIMRPLWSFTQPPRPDYFALLGALCQIEKGMDVNAVPRSAMEELHRQATLQPDGHYSVMDVYDLFKAETLPYADIYRHMRLEEKVSTFEALRRTPIVRDLERQVERVILKNPKETWPPKSAKHSVPAVIDVPALNAVVQCDSFANGDLTVSRAAIQRMREAMGHVTISTDRYMKLFHDLVDEEPRIFRTGPDGTPFSAPLGKTGFALLCEPLFPMAKDPAELASKLYRIIDIAQDRSITCAEALMGLTMLSTGGEDVRVKLLFDIFDMDHSGGLDREELHEMLRTVALRGLHLVDNLFSAFADDADDGEKVVFTSVNDFNRLEGEAEAAFAKADGDHDGELTQEEFADWISRNEMMRQYVEIPKQLFG